MYLLLFLFPPCTQRPGMGAERSMAQFKRLLDKLSSTHAGFAENSFHASGRYSAFHKALHAFQSL